jgi:hypothetical protein
LRGGAEQLQLGAILDASIGQRKLGVGQSLALEQQFLVLGRDVRERVQARTELGERRVGR